MDVPFFHVTKTKQKMSCNYVTAAMTRMTECKEFHSTFKIIHRLKNLLISKHDYANNVSSSSQKCLQVVTPNTPFCTHIIAHLFSSTFMPLLCKARIVMADPEK